MYIEKKENLPDKEIYLPFYNEDLYKDHFSPWSNHHLMINRIFLNLFLDLIYKKFSCNFIIIHFIFFLINNKLEEHTRL